LNCTDSTYTLVKRIGTELEVAIQKTAKKLSV